MDTNALKKFAQSARNLLIDQVTAKLGVVLGPASAARREQPAAVKALEGAIRQTSERQVIEQVAYTWFNRFTALRFMDVNGYTNPRVVSPAEGATRPEILADAMAGNLPEEAPATISALLEGRSPSNDPQAEAYRLLLVHACNAWHGAMPFLFEKVGDYTELLMPEDLLSPTSILARLREAMAEDACGDVEIIGWLYQFYISEKKDQVFAGLKKNIKITAENIPAATQLFTPHWIVRYLVENSLGRLWLLNRPGSKLAAQMDYFIAPEEPETDFLKIGKPEEIKICDPACGSGHMLTYSFDLLYAIYEEEGYDPAEIPTLILKHNLTGIEIDDRAGALAAFALSMKAAAKLGRRRFLRMETKPDIVVLQNVTFTSAELTDVAAVVGKDLFTDALRETLTQFEQAKNFGSLVVPKLRDPAETLRLVKARDFSSDLLLNEVQERVVTVLRMADALSPKYYVVVANPPYASATGLNSKLSAFVKTLYPDSKADLMTCFMERAGYLTISSGYWGMINLPSWMFISSFEKLRIKLLEVSSISSLVHLGRGIFGSDFGTVAFVVRNDKPDQKTFGTFRRLFERHVQVRTPEEIRMLFLNRDLGKFSRRQSELQKIPGNPIAYWASDKIVALFSDPNTYLGQSLNLREGINTGDNERFLRLWHEVPDGSFDRNTTDESGATKWKRHRKGGSFRKWYGNGEFVLNWGKSGREIHAFHNLPLDYRGAPMRGKQFFLKEAASWTRVSSGDFAIRHSHPGETFDSTAPSIFGEHEDLLVAEAYLNGPISRFLLGILSQTIDFRLTGLSRLPMKLPVASRQAVALSCKKIIDLARADWDAFETSWDFTTLPQLSPDHRDETLEATYARLRSHWQGMAEEMKRLEEENNRIFIGAYGLADELTPEVPIEEITLICNPAYRYGVKGSSEEREARLKADTMAEFLSYAVGCMFGRYSLDAPGLILANQGETLADYLARLQDKGVAEPSFLPDADNVIPALDGDWFSDDIVDRFRKFLRVTFGEERFRENLAFIEAQIGDIRKYFTRTFYEDHLKRYKKRPIYWMFSSPKGTFQALIYMHRYRPETVSVLLNDYLREFIRKLEAERARLDKLSDDPSAAQNVRTRALKDVGTVAKQIAELEEWERDVIFPLAQKKIEIDLDDGVKRNYPLFGAALKPIKGLEAADE
ncbi:BREX-1 system adenine-specific DNA-methyltransferase PglX [Rhizobium ruizarguesonis]